MISRRDFLKLIGIVPVVLVMPIPQNLPEELVTPFPVPDFSLPIWCHRPPVMPVDEIERIWYQVNNGGDYPDVVHVTVDNLL